MPILKAKFKPSAQSKGHLIPKPVVPKTYVPSSTQKSLNENKTLDAKQGKDKASSKQKTQKAQKNHTFQDRFANDTINL